MNLAEYAACDALALADLIHSREITAREVGELALLAAGKLNPRLNCLIEMFPERVAALGNTVPPGPFAGVPTALKDLYKFEAGTLSEGGCLLTQGLRGAYDSEVVLRLRRAGLLIIGRTTVPEMGWASACNTRLQGLTRNPWNPDVYPGGSSSGAAAAVAAGILPLAHASDGGGSTRGPAACTGLVGLKPTRGRVSDGPGAADPNAGMSAHLAVTRSVRDTAAVLDALSGPAVGDPHRAPRPTRPFLAEVGHVPRRLQIAVTTQSVDGNPIDSEIVQAVQGTARLLESMGHRVADAAPDYSWEGLLNATHVIWSAGVAYSCDRLGAQLGRRPGPDNLMQSTWATYQYGKSVTAADYLAALDQFNVLRRQVGRFFETYDVLVTPTMTRFAQPHAAQDQDRDVDAATWTRIIFTPDAFSPLFNVTGQPAISLPLHQARGGAQIGTQLVGRFGDDATLIQLSAVLEQALPWRHRRPALHVANIA